MTTVSEILAEAEAAKRQAIDRMAGVLIAEAVAPLVTRVADLERRLTDLEAQASTGLMVDDPDIAVTEDQ